MPGLLASKLLCRAIVVGGFALLLATAIGAWLKGGGPVVFRSAESRTREGGPVYNAVTFSRAGSRDIWLMKQSHRGPRAPVKDWDRLAIVVSEGPAGKTARYYQLEPGDAPWREGSREIPRRATCYLCHANGPRALRPADALSWSDAVKVFAWNLKIKAYGPVALAEEEVGTGPVPVRFAARFENETLKAKSCTKCHGGNGWFARNPLLRQQAATISFMVESGHMPPPGFSIGAEDRRAIEDFTRGL